jgi:FtsP/CotA-like multicopper oxidase with cupredoxin domain
MPSLATSRWLSRFAVAVALPAASLPLAAQTHERSSAAPQAAGRAPALRVIPNDNRTRAGTLRGEILSVALEATEGMWYPDGDAAPGVLMQAFAEAGGAPRIPGPLVRTTAGTPIALTIRNALDVPITVSGLHGGNAPDTVQLGAGATRAIRVRFDSVGTYYYWGTSTGRTFDNRFGMDAQLSGAIVIDPAGAPPHVTVCSCSACGRIRRAGC